MLYLREDKNKQTTIKHYFRFVSPTLLARDHDPLSVRKTRRKKYSVSKRMVHVQPTLMNYYSSLIHPLLFPCPPSPSHLRLIVVFRPAVLLRIIRIVINCSKMEQKTKAQPPPRKRCKEEGKSYTMNWSNNWKLPKGDIDLSTAIIGCRFECRIPVLAIRIHTSTTGIVGHLSSTLTS